MAFKIYRTADDILIEAESGRFRLKNVDWDAFINDDALFSKLDLLAQSAAFDNTPLSPAGWLKPANKQEIWASGVTYFNSKLARQEESAAAGGGDFYARVYAAERPELFFKATASRCAGPGEHVRIRRDSDWDVPEPELTLFITSNGKIAAYTIGNDMSSRSIEGENPLYLPQAKTYDGCAALGPCLYVSEKPMQPDTEIRLVIERNGSSVFEGKTNIGQMKRQFDELVSWLFREMTFPEGCFLMTGTGIIPPREFTLRSGDEVRVTIEPIGTLVNTVL